MSKRIDLEEAHEGMVLAEPVLNKLGQVMLGKGISLKLKQINVLKMWGIKQIAINNLEEDIPEETNYELLEETKLKIKQQLGWNDDNSFLNELIELAAISSCQRNRGK